MHHEVKCIQKNHKNAISICCMYSSGVTCSPIQQSRSYTFSPQYSQWYVYDEVRYSCNKGWQIVGHSTSTCLENGDWSHPPPTCRSMR